MKPLPTTELRDLLQAQQDLLKRCLGGQFGRLPLRQLGSKVGEIEGWTVAYLRKTLWDLSSLILGCDKCTQPEHILDSGSGAVFEICVGRSVHAPRNLNVAFLQKHVPSNDAPEERQFAVESFGPFSNASIFLPPSLTPHGDTVLQLVRAIVEGSGQWVTEAVSAVISRQENRLTKRIYAKLQSAVRDDLLLKNLWVGCVTDKFGFRLIDPRAATSAARIFQESVAVHGHSANRMLAELISTRLPCEGLLMNVARSAHQAIDGDMRHARYRKEGTIYAEVLAGLYGKDSFSILPLFVDSIFGVFVLMPTEQRAAVESTLDANKEALSSIIRLSRGAIVAAQSAFDDWGNEQPSASIPREADAHNSRNSLCQQGQDFWEIRFNGKGPFGVKHSVGVEYLAMLLEAPGISFHCSQLAARRGCAAVVSRLSSENTPVLTSETKRSYRANLEELDEQIATAESEGRPDEAAQLREDAGKIRKALSAAHDKLGRNKGLADDGNRMRNAVCNPIRRVINSLRDGSQTRESGLHFQDQVALGFNCIYPRQPEKGVRWLVER